MCFLLVFREELDTLVSTPIFSSCNFLEFFFASEQFLCTTVRFSSTKWKQHENERRSVLSMISRVCSEESISSFLLRYPSASVSCLRPPIIHPRKFSNYNNLTSGPHLGCVWNHIFLVILLASGCLWVRNIVFVWHFCAYVSALQGVRFQKSTKKSSFIL